MNASIPALILIALGIGLLLVGGIWGIVVAFRRSLVWGLCYLFVPFAALVFLFVAWADAKRAFFTHLAGLAVLMGGVYLGMPSGLDLKKQMAAKFSEGVKMENAVTVPDPQASLKQRFDELAVREKSLLTRKSALDPQDLAGAQALTGEILQYNDDLQAANAEKAAGAGQVVSYVPAPK